MNGTARRDPRFTVAVISLWCLFASAGLCQYGELVVAGVKIDPALKKTNQTAVEQYIRHEVGQPLDRKMADEDLNTILTTFGTFNRKRELSYWKTEPTGEANSVFLVYHLTENPDVTKIEVSGNTVVPTEKIIQAVSKDLPIGQIYNSTQASRLGNTVETLYADSGYLAQLDAADFNEQTGVLKLTVVEMYVYEIRVRGLDKTNEKVVRRELKTEKGSLLNLDTLTRDLDRLRNLDIFEQVLIPQGGEGLAPGPNPGDTIVVIDVKEKKTGALSVGVGYSNREGIIGFAEFREKNIGGMGRQLSGRVEVGSGVHLYDVTYREPWLDNNHTSLEVSLYDQTLRQNRTSFSGFTPSEALSTEQRTGGTVNVMHPLNSDETQWISGRYRYEKIVNQDPRLVNIIAPSLRRGNVGSFTVSWADDTRDSVFDPHKGGRLDLSLEQAGGPFGGQHRFTRADIEATHYINVADAGTIALRGLYGTVVGNVPIFETYGIGGANTLRGYREDRFFGVNQALFQFEFRKYLGGGGEKSDLQLVAFADVGDAWGGQWQASDGTIYRAEHRRFTPKLGYGLGVRVSTALGPIRLDFALGDEGPRTHFGLSQTF